MMDFSIGVAGLIRAGVAAVADRIDPRVFVARGQHWFDVTIDEDDPNSTLSVTRQVVAEQLQSRKVDRLSPC